MKTFRINLKLFLPLPNPVNAFHDLNLLCAAAEQKHSHQTVQHHQTSHKTQYPELALPELIDRDNSCQIEEQKHIVGQKGADSGVFMPQNKPDRPAQPLADKIQKTALPQVFRPDPPYQAVPEQAESSA